METTTLILEDGDLTSPVTNSPFASYLSSTVNGSEDDVSSTPSPSQEALSWSYISYVVAEVLVAVLAVLGNALVVYVFSTTRSLRRYRNYYIVALAVADFLVGLLGIPLAVMSKMGYPRNLHGCLFAISTLIVLCTISILCLVAVSVDRYWATTNPFAYYRNMTTTTSVGIIVTCWVVGAVLGFLPLLGWYNDKGWQSQRQCIFVHIMDYNYLVFLYFATIIFPAVLMAAFYGYIYHVVLIKIRQKGTLIPASRRLSTTSRSGSLNSELRGTAQILRIMQTEKRREAKAAKKLGIIVLFFMICWMPLYTINCIQAFVTINIPVGLMDFTIILSHANSALNPLLYAYHLKEFRFTMKNALCALFAWLSCGYINVPDPKDPFSPASRSHTIPSLANQSLSTTNGRISIKFRKPGMPSSSSSDGGLRISPRANTDDSNGRTSRYANGRVFRPTPSADNLYYPSSSATYSGGGGGSTSKSATSLSLIHKPLTSQIPLHYTLHNCPAASDYRRRVDQELATVSESEDATSMHYIPSPISPAGDALRSKSPTLSSSSCRIPPSTTTTTMTTSASESAVKESESTNNSRVSSPASPPHNSTEESSETNHQSNNASPPVVLQWNKSSTFPLQV